MTKETIEENKKFLDSVAKITLAQYLRKQSLTGFKDSMSLARISYKQALAFLKVREDSLVSLAEEEGLIKKDKNE